MYADGGLREPHPRVDLDGLWRLGHTLGTHLGGGEGHGPRADDGLVDGGVGDVYWYSALFDVAEISTCGLEVRLDEGLIGPDAAAECLREWWAARGARP